MGDQQNERRYTDLGGQARTLREMIVLEPEWAANRIKQCEKLEAVAGDTVDWNYAQAVSDLLDVHDALCCFSHDSTGDNGVEVVRAIIGALSHAGRAAVGIFEPADHQSVGALVGDEPLRMALAETSPRSIQLLPEGTRIFAHASPQVAEKYQQAAERYITQACRDAVEKLNELAPHMQWDSGDSTAEIYIRRLRAIAAPTAPAGEPNADDAARELFRPVDLPHREEAAIYRAALETIARYPRNANEELGYPACRSIASEAIGEADLLLANAVTPSEASE